MKVLMLGTYTVGDTIGGGAERHIYNLVKKLSNYSDLDLHIISISKNIKKNTTIKLDGFTLHQIKSPFLPITITGVSIDAYRIIKLVKKLNPDILHGQMLGAPYGLVTGLLSKRYKTILTVHSIISEDVKYKTHSFNAYIHDFIWKHLEKYELKVISNFIAVSTYIRAELKKHSKSNLFLIPNGIDDKWFKYNYIETNKNNRILFVGRITPFKRIEHLLYVSKNICDSGNVIELHIVGPIDDRIYFNKLQKIVVKLKIDKIVNFMGQIDEHQLMKEYEDCSIFVLPSQNEPFGIVLLEALAKGKPVVAFKTGGIPDIIKNGENGFLVKYGDINGLAEKITELINDKKLREELSKNGRKYARNFSWIEIAKKTYMLYNQILKERQL